MRTARHALALDERRRYYAEYRLDPEQVADPDRDLVETWFTGAHSDVGGGLNDPQPLADISLAWMLDEAADCGLDLDTRRYKAALDIEPGNPIPPLDPEVAISHNKRIWWFAGAGWRRRKPATGDPVHASVAAWRQAHP